MDENGKSILVLNDYCLLKIIKYIIADCEFRDKSQGNKMKYLDLVSFALAHEDLEAVLKEYYDDLYEDLNFLFVANRERLEIDFAKLQSTYTGKAGDVFWRFLVDAIRENSNLNSVQLQFVPISFQPDFLNNFQMIKCALEKKRIWNVFINFIGYSLDDLNNFGHIVSLYLHVRISAEALATICKSNPDLKYLYIMSSDIFGRLSDIVPHCRNLEILEYVPKPDVDGAEYAPLAQLPKLYEMIIHGALKNGSLLPMFGAIQKWQRPETQRLRITFTDMLPLMSSVTLPEKNLLRSLQTTKGNSDTSVNLKASYNFSDLTTYIDPSEESHATFTLIEGVAFNGLFFIRWLTLKSYRALNASALALQLKVFNVQFLELNRPEGNSQAQLAKLFGLLHPEGSFALKTMLIEDQALDRSETAELVKIQSLQSLKSTFTHWESFDHLSKLTNLQEIGIFVEEELEESSSQPLCNFLSTCHENLLARLHCNNGWTIILREMKLYLDINSDDRWANLLTPLSQINGITLMLKRISRRRSLDDLHLNLDEDLRGFQELPKEILGILAPR